MRRHFVWIAGALAICFLSIFIWLESKPSELSGAGKPLLAHLRPRQSDPEMRAGAEGSGKTRPSMTHLDHSGMPIPSPATVQHSDNAGGSATGGVFRGGKMHATYPDLPGDVYGKHIAAARDGDAASQFAVYEALSSCTGVPTPESFDEIVRQGKLSPQESGVIGDMLARCASLRIQAPEQNTLDKSAEWLSLAKAQQYVPAMARDAAAHPNRHTQEQAREIMMKAVHYLGAAAGYEVAAYHANYFQDHAVDEESWFWLGCAADAGCDIQNLRQDMEANLRPNEFDAIQARVKDIEAALRNGDSDSLFP